MIIFLGIIILISSFLSYEFLIKYFIIQSLRSNIFLWFFLLNSVTNNYVSSTFILIIIFIKLALPPFHTWFLNLITILDWKSIWLISTLQKIIPLILLSLILPKNFFLFFIFLGLLIVFINSLSIKYIKLALGISRIFASLWIISIILIKEKIISFLLIYSLSLFLVIFLCSLLESPPLLWNKNLFIEQTVILIILFLNLGGIPPFAGFWVKFIAFQELIFLNMEVLGFSLVIVSAWLIFIYIQLIVSRINQISKNLLILPISNNNLMPSYILILVVMAPLLLFIF